jgi:hypothetical protein
MTDVRDAGLHDGVITNDREFLAALDMTDAQAAMYLGKSRQALNNKLKSKRRSDAPDDYFKASDLLILVIAARRLGKEFDVREVRRYVERTRSAADGDAYAMLIQELEGNDDIEREVMGASTVVLIIPEYDQLSKADPSGADQLTALAGMVRQLPSNPWIVVLSISEVKANTAARQLGLSGVRVRPVSHEYVDHYTPMALIYGGSGDDDVEPRPFLLTDTGRLVAAPHFRAPMMSDCVKYMLPKEVREELFPTAQQPATLDKSAES